MRETLIFDSQLLLSRYNLSLNPFSIGEFTAKESNLASKSHLRHSSIAHSHRNQTLKPIVCARKNRRPSGSQKLRRILPHLVSFMASNVMVIPEPLNLVIREFVGGGAGGGLGFSKGFGWGSFDGWRRKGKKHLWLYGVLMVTGFGLLMLFGGEVKSEVYLGFLTLGLFGAFFTSKRVVKDAILGLCLAVALMVMVRREHLQKWVHKLKDFTPVVELRRRKKKSKTGSSRRFV